MNKPKLNATEQVEHLKKKGVLFNIDSEEYAKNYLSSNNNFFKLTSYRKNFPKNSEGLYTNLEFAYLRDLAVIDMRIRKCLLDMCLDVEHDTRRRIVQIIEGREDEDGYSIVIEYRDANLSSYETTLKQAANSPYCRDLIEKYKESMPIWALVEILQFNNLCHLLKLLADKYHRKDLESDFYLLQEIRKLRNACAHNNCILNDLKSVPHDNNTQGLYASFDVATELARIGISKRAKRRKMSNERIRQMVILLYYYKTHISSFGMLEHQAKSLQEAFITRPHRNFEYYRSLEQITSFFIFIKKVVDNWFPCE